MGKNKIKRTVMNMGKSNEKEWEYSERDEAKN
jgi:hypothetical protein